MQGIGEFAAYQALVSYSSLQRHKSMFWMNDGYFLVSVASLYCAFHRFQTGVMIHACGDGGDGKWLHAALETAVLDPENCATLEPNVFIEPGEFRKSGHFACNKMRVGIDECKGRNTFEFDVWERFVVGDPIDVRCNFGQTVKMSFRGMKCQ